MTENCKNCNEIIAQNFCSYCGQKKFKLIDRKYVWDELQYTIIHTNKGLLYTSKKLIKNPGKTAREYIDGTRVNHYKPLSLAFVLSGVIAFFSYKILNFNEILNKYLIENNLQQNVRVGSFDFFSNYFSIIMLLLVPIFALASKLAFRKWGHNFYEHIILNSYILSFFNLISFGFIPILFFYKNSPSKFINISMIPFLLMPLILVWFFKEFYNERPLKTIIWKSLLNILISILFYFIIMLIVLIIGLVYVLLFNPTAINNINTH